MTRKVLSLRTWLLLLALAIAVPLLGFGGAVLGWMTMTHHAARTRDQADRARALAFAVGSELRAWRAALQALAETAELQAGRFGAFDAAARAVAAQHDGWVVVNDAAGQQRVNTLRPPGAPLPRTAAGAMVEAVFRDGAPLTDLVYGAAAQRYIISNSVPVVLNGRVRYCLSLNFGPERLTRLLQAQQLPPGWVAGIVTAENRIVARTREAETWVGQLAPAWVKEATATAESGVITETLLEGTRARAAFQRLPEAPWIVVVAVPTAELDAASRPVMAFALVGLGLVAAAGAAARYVGRAIARPVSRLADAGTAMLQGKVADVPAGSRIGEIQELQAAMAEAAGTVRAYYRAREQAAVAAAAADAVHASEARIRDILESVQDAFCAVDGDWRLTYVTAKTAELWGRRPEELLGRSLWDALPEQVGGAPYRHLQRAMRERVVVCFEAESLVFRRWMECRAYPTNPAGLSVYFRDISERKQAEERIRQLHRDLAVRNAELEAERTRWEGVVQGIADEVWVCDARGRMSLVNLASVTAMGLAAFRDKTVHEVLAEVDILTLDGQPRPAEQAPLLRALRGEVVRGEEIMRHRATGTTRYRQFSCAPTRDAAGAISGAVAIVRDITDLKQTEAELTQTAADNETLLKEVHHRTKNNLQMLCSLLELQAEAIQSPEGKEALELSAQRIYAIARLYEQLYRSMSGGRILLCDYLRGLAENFRYVGAVSGITVRLPERNGIYLDVDRAIPCGLILNELLTNAVKHAFPPGHPGQVGIQLERQGEERVQLRVWDNGRGLPPGLDIERSNSLGLRLIRILAHRLRAQVEVDSYEGAAFTLTFPAAAEE
jgi:PAS domain S-box-containing protein